MHPYIKLKKSNNNKTSKKIAPFKGTRILPYGPLANTTEAGAYTVTQMVQFTNGERCIIWPSSEHAYHAQKLIYILENLKPTQLKKRKALEAALIRILNTKAKPGEQFHPRNDLYPILYNLEHEHRINANANYHLHYHFMRNILELKLEQHPALKALVLDCAREGIMPIEISEHDMTWASGLDGMGKNELGILWLEIGNDILRQQGETPAIRHPRKYYQEIQLEYQTDISHKNLVGKLKPGPAWTNQNAVDLSPSADANQPELILCSHTGYLTANFHDDNKYQLRYQSQSDEITVLHRDNEKIQWQDAELIIAPNAIQNQNQMIFDKARQLKTAYQTLIANLNQKNKNREIARKLWNNEPLARILPAQWRDFSNWIRTPSSHATLEQIGIPGRNFAAWIADNPNNLDLITIDLPNAPQHENIKQSINQYQQKDDPLEKYRQRLREGKKLFFFDRDDTIFTENKEVINPGVMLPLLNHIHKDHVLNFISIGGGQGQNAEDSIDEFLRNLQKELPEFELHTKLYVGGYAASSLRDNRNPVWNFDEISAGNINQDIEDQEKTFDIAGFQLTLKPSAFVKTNIEQGKSIFSGKNLAMLRRLAELRCKPSQAVIAELINSLEGLVVLTAPNDFYELANGQVVFCDDHTENITAARKLGFTAIQADTQSALDSLHKRAPTLTLATPQLTYAMLQTNLKELLRKSKPYKIHDALKQFYNKIEKTDKTEVPTQSILNQYNALVQQIPKYTKNVYLKQLLAEIPKQDLAAKNIKRAQALLQLGWLDKITTIQNSDNASYQQKAFDDTSSGLGGYSKEREKIFELYKDNPFTTLEMIFSLNNGNPFSADPRSSTIQQFTSLLKRNNISKIQNIKIGDIVRYILTKQETDPKQAACVFNAFFKRRGFSLGRLLEKQNDRNFRDELEAKPQLLAMLLTKAGSELRIAMNEVEIIQQNNVHNKNIELQSELENFSEKLDFAARAVAAIGQAQFRAMVNSAYNQPTEKEKYIALRNLLKNPAFRERKDLQQIPALFFSESFDALRVRVRDQANAYPQLKADLNKFDQAKTDLEKYLCLVRLYANAAVIDPSPLDNIENFSEWLLVADNLSFFDNFPFKELKTKGDFSAYHRYIVKRFQNARGNRIDYIDALKQLVAEGNDVTGYITKFLDERNESNVLQRYLYLVRLFADHNEPVLLEIQREEIKKLASNTDFANSFGTLQTEVDAIAYHEYLKIILDNTPIGKKFDKLVSLLSNSPKILRANVEQRNASLLYGLLNRYQLLPGLTPENLMTLLTIKSGDDCIGEEFAKHLITIATTSNIDVQVLLDDFINHNIPKLCELAKISPCRQHPLLTYALESNNINDLTQRKYLNYVAAYHKQVPDLVEALDKVQSPYATDLEIDNACAALFRMDSILMNIVENAGRHSNDAKYYFSEKLMQLLETNNIQQLQTALITKRTELLARRVNTDTYHLQLPPVFGDDFQVEPINYAAGECRLTIGDLHGNALKLIYILAKKGIININAPDYMKLVNIYYKEVSELTSVDIADFDAIIAGLTLRPNAQQVLITLLGDMLADRGSNDYFVLKILDKLKELNANYEIKLSNHDFEAIEHFDELGTDIAFTALLGSEQDISFLNMNTIIKKGLIDKAAVQTLFDNAYKPKLKLISYGFENNGQMLVTYMHAPVGMLTIQEIAEKLGVKYQGRTNRERKDTIDKINQAFTDQYSGDLKKWCQSFPKEGASATVLRPIDHPKNKIQNNQDIYISLEKKSGNGLLRYKLTKNGKIIKGTIKQSELGDVVFKNIERKMEENPEYFTGESDPGLQIFKILSKREHLVLGRMHSSNPFMRLIWNRDQEEFEKLPPFVRCVYGHDTPAAAAKHPKGTCLNNLFGYKDRVSAKKDEAGFQVSKDSMVFAVVVNANVSNTTNTILAIQEADPKSAAELFKQYFRKAKFTDFLSRLPFFWRKTNFRKELWNTPLELAQILEKAKPELRQAIHDTKIMMSDYYKEPVIAVNASNEEQKALATLRSEWILAKKQLLMFDDYAAMLIANKPEDHATLKAFAAARTEDLVTQWIQDANLDFNPGSAFQKSWALCVDVLLLKPELICKLFVEGNAQLFNFVSQQNNLQPPLQQLYETKPEYFLKLLNAVENNREKADAILDLPGFIALLPNLSIDNIFQLVAKSAMPVFTRVIDQAGLLNKLIQALQDNPKLTLLQLVDIIIRTPEKAEKILPIILELLPTQPMHIIRLLLDGNDVLRKEVMDNRDFFEMLQEKEKLVALSRALQKNPSHANQIWDAIFQPLQIRDIPEHAFQCLWSIKNPDLSKKLIAKIDLNYFIDKPNEFERIIDAVNNRERQPEEFIQTFKDWLLHNPKHILTLIERSGAELFAVIIRQKEFVPVLRDFVLNDTKQLEQRLTKLIDIIIKDAYKADFVLEHFGAALKEKPALLCKLVANFDLQLRSFVEVAQANVDAVVDEVCKIPVAKSEKGIAMLELVTDKLTQEPQLIVKLLEATQGDIFSFVAQRFVQTLIDNFDNYATALIEIMKKQSVKFLMLSRDPLQQKWINNPALISRLISNCSVELFSVIVSPNPLTDFIKGNFNQFGSVLVDAVLKNPRHAEVFLTNFQEQLLSQAQPTLICRILINGDMQLCENLSTAVLRDIGRFVQLQERLRAEPFVSELKKAIVQDPAKHDLLTRFLFGTPMGASLLEAFRGNAPYLQLQQRENKRNYKIFCFYMDKIENKKLANLIKNNVKLDQNYVLKDTLDLQTFVDAINTKLREEIGLACAEYNAIANKPIELLPNVFGIRSYRQDSQTKKTPTVASISKESNKFKREYYGNLKAYTKLAFEKAGTVIISEKLKAFLKFNDVQVAGADIHAALQQLTPQAAKICYKLFTVELRDIIKKGREVIDAEIPKLNPRHEIFAVDENKVTFAIFGSSSSDAARAAIDCGLEPVVSLACNKFNQGSGARSHAGSQEEYTMRGSVNAAARMAEVICKDENYLANEFWKLDDFYSIMPGYPSDKELAAARNASSKATTKPNNSKATHKAGAYHLKLDLEQPAAGANNHDAKYVSGVLEVIDKSQPVNSMNLGRVSYIAAAGYDLRMTSKNSKTDRHLFSQSVIPFFSSAVDQKNRDEKLVTGYQKLFEAAIASYLAVNDTPELKATHPLFLVAWGAGVFAGQFDFEKKQNIKLIARAFCQAMHVKANELKGVFVGLPIFESGEPLVRKIFEEAVKDFQHNEAVQILPREPFEAKLAEINGSSVESTLSLAK